MVWSLRIAGIEKGRLTCLISMVSAGSTPAPASKFYRRPFTAIFIKFLAEKIERYGLVILNMVRKHIRYVRSPVKRMAQGSNP